MSHIIAGMRNAIFLPLVAVGLASCGSRDLSRDAAKDILASNIQKYNGRVTFAVKDVMDACLRASGLMRNDGPVSVLTPRGSQILTDVGWNSVGLRNPLQATVTEVTGIAKTADGSATITEYSIKLSAPSLNKSEQDCVVPSGPQKSRATLRRFDDGWRIENVGGEFSK